jgi:hypothetical protein
MVKTDVTPDQLAQKEQFRAHIWEKVQLSLGEFAAGRISREQFHAMYEYYNAQLQLAEESLRRGYGQRPQGGMTYAVRQAHMGKAVGLLIFHNASGRLIETLGQFDIATASIAPILNDLSLLNREGTAAVRQVRHYDARRWLLFSPAAHTTVVTLFHHEPSQAQMDEMERLHRDFETANLTALTTSKVDSSMLAYPFLVFVQQRVKRA